MAFKTNVHSNNSLLLLQGTDASKDPRPGGTVAQALLSSLVSVTC